MYDQAAQAQFINTYAPINFSELYRIGATQKAAMDEAVQQFGVALQKFGEFRSPSAVDTQNWYNLTIGRKDMQDAINQLATNPEALKDAGFRASLQSLINSTDYASLSQLRESADNLRKGIEMRAKMEAEGTYNPNWDDSNIQAYDTLGNRRVFDDITPIRYMTANELSDQYYNNLKPSTLPNQTIEGVRYNVQGITYDTLHQIANARFNDLVSTPQGQMYYRDLLKANNGDVDAARNAFVGMIADSQRDRIIEQRTVDPAWLAQLEASLTRRAMSGNETQQVNRITRKMGIENSWNNTVVPRLRSEAANNPNNEANKKALAAQQLANEAIQKQMEAQRTGNQQLMDEALQLQQRSQYWMNEAGKDTQRDLMLREFNSKAGFKLNQTDPNSSKDYSKKGYNAGVNAALSSVSFTTDITREDPLLTYLGGIPMEMKKEDGTYSDVFRFDNSEGFMLPESVFTGFTGTGQAKVERRGSLFRSNSDFVMQQVLEQGGFDNVLFVPSRQSNMVQLGDQKLIKGKIRIPREEVERKLGTGTLPGTFFGVESTEDIMVDSYGAKKEMVYDETGTEYFEFDIYKQLPSDEDFNYWHAINLRRENSPSNEGIGGASQASDMQDISVRTIMGI